MTHIDVNLFAEDHAFVAIVSLPDFESPPAVLLWFPFNRKA